MNGCAYMAALLARQALGRPAEPPMIDRMRQAMIDHGPAVAAELARAAGCTVPRALTILGRDIKRGYVAKEGRSYRWVGPADPEVLAAIRVCQRAGFRVLAGEG